MKMKVESRKRKAESRAAPIGVRCTVQPLDGGAYFVAGGLMTDRSRHTVDGEYSGNCVFDVARRRAGDIITARRATEAQLVAAGIVAPLEWAPTVDLQIFPMDPSSADVDVYWQISGEPDHALYTPTHGWGHEFWLVVVVNTVEIFAGAIEAGGLGHALVNVGGTGVAVSGTATLYTSSTLGTTVDTATADATS